jgi:hypothetical protein
MLRRHHPDFDIWDRFIKLAKDFGELRGNICQLRTFPMPKFIETV